MSSVAAPSPRPNPGPPNVQLPPHPPHYEVVGALVKVVEAKTKFTMPSKSSFLTFEPVTVVPIQAKMIEADLMTKQEVEWLNSYHQTCRDR